MNKTDLVAQGAEAKLFVKEIGILKERFRKNYRIKEIDEKLRGFRTRREAKILEKLAVIDFPSPKLIRTDEKENIIMEKIGGPLIKDILNKENYMKLCTEIGRKIAILHNQGIIHGDLTTSNMIFRDEVYFIDFGLSFFSHKIEDMAVDLHLLKEGLMSKHYAIGEDAFNEALAAYGKECRKGADVIKRLKVVEGRGRYRKKVR